MGVLYKCKGCGLGIDVAAGAAKFPGMTIHCPSCGGKAHYHPAGLGAHSGEVVKVALGEDGTATQPLSSLKDDAEETSASSEEVEMQPTIRVSALETQQVEPLTHVRDMMPTPRVVDSVPTPRSVDSVPVSPKVSKVVEERVPESGSKVTPVGAPFVTTKENKTEREIPSVTRIRSVKIEPSAGERPEVGPTEILPARSEAEVADTDRGFFKPPEEAAAFTPAPSPGPPQPQMVAPPPDDSKEGLVGGKAWSASVIRRALRASGVEDSGPTEADGKKLDTGLIFEAGDRKQVQVEIPGAGLPIIVEDEQTLNIVPPEVVGESGAEQAVAVRGRKPKAPENTDPKWDSGMVSSVLLQERKRRRQLFFMTLLGALVGLGVVLGYVLDFSSESTDPVREPPDPAVVAVAEERALRYDLGPIDFTAPFDISTEMEMIDYPNRLFLRLDVTNLSNKPVSALRLSGSWHIVHDAPTQVYSTETTYEPSPSLASPLAPGEALTALMELEADFTPPGEPVESFVWVTLIAMSEDRVVTEASVLMVDVPTD